MALKDPVKRKKYNAEYHAKNKSAILEQKKGYYTGNLGKIKARDSVYRRSERGRFAHSRCAKLISFDDFIALREKQNNLCAICGKKCSSGKHLSIDHDHKTNKVRGLLCMSCNFGLGKFKDDTELLEKAIQYLKNS